MERWFILSKQAFQSQSEFSQQQTWFSGSVTNQKTVTMSQAEQTISDVSLLWIRRWSGELFFIVSTAWRGDFVCVCVWFLKMKYTEEFEQSKAKGSFPAMITPGYQAAKQANTLASNVRRLSDAAESFWRKLEQTS